MRALFVASDRRRVGTNNALPGASLAPQCRGSRIVETMVAGCIPVIVQDGVFQPGHDVLPYEAFSVRTPPSPWCRVKRQHARALAQSVQRFRFSTGQPAARSKSHAKGTRKHSARYTGVFHVRVLRSRFASKTWGTFPKSCRQSRRRRSSHCRRARWHTLHCACGRSRCPPFFGETTGGCFCARV